MAASGGHWSKGKFQPRSTGKTKPKPKSKPKKAAKPKPKRAETFSDAYGIMKAMGYKGSMADYTAMLKKLGAKDV